MDNDDNDGNVVEGENNITKELDDNVSYWDTDIHILALDGEGDNEFVIVVGGTKDEG